MENGSEVTVPVGAPLPPEAPRLNFAPALADLRKDAGSIVARIRALAAIAILIGAVAFDWRTERAVLWAFVIGSGLILAATHRWPHARLLNLWILAIGDPLAIAVGIQGT